MPRNGSGVYSPTAGIPVVSGTTISSTAFNNVIDDLGDEITASLPVSGVAPMTGVLRVTLGSVSAPGLAFVGDTDTGLYSTGANSLSLATNGTAALTVSATQTTTWTAKAVGKAFDVDAITDVASAATCDIGAAATSEVNITGTTTITSFGTSNAGIVRRGTFAGILTLTHNATSLILPGGANITTAAGDSFVARSLGSGNWRVLSYSKASGVANVVSRSGCIGQIVGNATTAVSTGTTTIPFDDTAPLSSEGDQYLSQAITPASASSTLEVTVTLTFATSVAQDFTVALFRDGTLLRALPVNMAGAGQARVVTFTETVSASSTSASTFTVRAGGASAGTTTVNGTGGNRLYGATNKSSIYIREILP